MMLRYQRTTAGFTLLEMMITVAIIGIIAAIAFPSYQNYVRKARRADAITLMLENAQFMERFYTENGRYDQTLTGTPVALAYMSSPKEGGNKYYDFGLEGLDSESFTIRASPKDGQANDECGILILKSTGSKGVLDKTDSTFISRCWAQ